MAVQAPRLLSIRSRGGPCWCHRVVRFVSREFVSSRRNPLGVSAFAGHLCVRQDHRRHRELLWTVKPQAARGMGPPASEAAWSGARGPATTHVRPRKTTMIDKDRALRGRAARMMVADRHAIHGTPMEEAFPGMEMALSGWAASGALRRASGCCQACIRRPSGTPVGIRPTRVTRKSARDRRATPKWYGSSSICRHVVRRHAETVLGRARSHAGHAAGR